MSCSTIQHQERSSSQLDDFLYSNPYDEHISPSYDMVFEYQYNHGIFLVGTCKLGKENSLAHD